MNRLFFFFLFKLLVTQFLFDHVATKIAILPVHVAGQKFIPHHTIICKAALNVRIKWTYLLCHSSVGCVLNW